MAIEPEVKLSQMQVGQWKLRRELDRFLVSLDGAVPLLESLVSETHVVVGRAEPRLKLDRLLIVADRLAVLPLVIVDAADVVVSTVAIEIGFVLGRLGEHLKGQVPFSRTDVDRPEIVLGCGIVGPELQGPLVVDNRLVVLVQALVGEAETVLDFRILVDPTDPDLIAGIAAARDSLKTRGPRRSSTDRCI